MLTQEEYLKTKGTRCPNCFSENVFPFSLDFCVDIVEGSAECRDCGAEWTDIYVLRAYKDLELPS